MRFFLIIGRWDFFGILDGNLGTKEEGCYQQEKYYLRHTVLIRWLSSFNSSNIGQIKSFHCQKSLFFKIDVYQK